ncbi:unnamed protein product [Rhizophagus irregularis]|nr:unnamed protein product [Rhizophagus irregularis]
MRVGEKHLLTNRTTQFHSIFGGFGRSLDSKLMKDFEDVGFNEDKTLQKKPKTANNFVLFFCSELWF